MIPIMSRGYKIKEDAFLALTATELETLIEELVRFEARERHASDVEIEPRPPANERGQDLGVRVHSAPLISAQDFGKGFSPLTFDDCGLTVYSVKSGKNWEAAAVQEAKARSDWALHALRDGGHFVLVTSKTAESSAGSKKGTLSSKVKRAAAGKKLQPNGTSTKTDNLRERLANAYFERLKTADSDATDPRDRIHIVNARDLEHYVKFGRPALSHPLRERLGMPEIADTFALEAWTRHHEGERGQHRFFPDDARTAFKRTIREMVCRPAGSSPNAIWIASPPGVGKTRAVIEALRKDHDYDPTSRTFFALDADAGMRAIQEEQLFKYYADAVLVVDDCQIADAETLHRAFQPTQAATDAPHGTLLLISAIAAESIPQTSLLRVPRHELRPLQEGACEALIRYELAQTIDDAAVANIAELCEGYPWFAILIAEELKSDPRPLTLTLDEAIELAICPRSQEGRALEIEKRVAALFVVMLTENEDLSQAKTARADIVSAFSQWFPDWSALKKTTDDCAERGLVRRGAGGAWRYVTPSILEREVARRMLIPPTPGGSPLDLEGRSMRARRDRLLQRLQQLGFEKESLAVLSEPIVRRMQSDLALVSETELLLAARHHPTDVAAAIHSHLRCVDIEVLRADKTHRRSWVFALQTTAGSRDSFDDSEATLFRLACAENETYANNATKVWAGLFDLELNTTYLTFDQKRDVLTSRLTSDVENERLVALNALESMLTMWGFKAMVGTGPDGPYPRPAPAEARLARGVAWELLRDRMTDASARIADAAVKVAVDNLRASIRTGVGLEAATALTGIAHQLTELQRRKLREEVALADRFDAESVGAHGLEGSWAHLRKALDPQSFSDRLRQHVGVWGMAILSANEDPQDRLLAREGLTPPAPIIRELPWLLSSDAVRSLPFAIAVGVEDTSEILFPLLIANPQGAENFLSGYLRGHQEAGRTALVDRAIQTLRERGQFNAAAMSIWRAQANPKRVRWLLEDLRARRIDDRAIELFGFASWALNLSDQELVDLVEVLIEIGGAGPRTAVDLALRRIDRDPRAAETFDTLLLEAFATASETSPTGHFAYEWSLAAKRLLATGKAAEVLSTAARLIDSPEASLPRSEVVAIFNEAGALAPDLAWSEVRKVLERNEAGNVRRYAIVWACKNSNLTAALPVDSVMSWVGDREARARQVADLVSMQAPELPALARAIVVRFGPHSVPAKILASDLGRTPRAVSSLATFAEQQLTRASAWATDEDPRVRRFAETIVKQQRAARDHYAGLEAYERRRLGS